MSIFRLFDKNRQHLLLGRYLPTGTETHCLERSKHLSCLEMSVVSLEKSL